jgi:DNA-binding response OmpR family regulator
VASKILIIDDEQDICFLLKRQLKLNQYLVQDASNLTDGYIKFKDFVPDVLILDINLPDGNGAENAYKFKELNKNTSIILISADNDQLNNKFTNYSANAFLKKPFTIDQLIYKIEKLSQINYSE